MTIILDIGGEGRHAQAWNLNPSRVRTLPPDRGEPIPRLIVGRADAVPIADARVDQITVEQTPLTEAALREIARVIAPGGTILLRHVLFPGRDQHALARRLLPGRVSQRTRTAGGRLYRETAFKTGSHVLESLPVRSEL